jgi:hypothetical protein
LKLKVSFCAAWAVSVLFTPPLFACLPARNDFFQSPVSGLMSEGTSVVSQKRKSG